MELPSVAVIFLILFSILSAIDGLYIHLIKFKLHENPETKKEHQLHTIRSFLFLLILLFLFYFKTSGYWLYITVFILLADVIIESQDMLLEFKSRKNIGGLPSYEYFLHGILILLRNFSIGLWMSQLEITDFGLKESVIVIRESGWIKSQIEQSMALTFVVFVVHVLFIFKPNILSRSTHKI